MREQSIRDDRAVVGVVGNAVKRLDQHADISEHRRVPRIVETLNLLQFRVQSVNIVAVVDGEQRSLRKSQRARALW